MFLACILTVSAFNMLPCHSPVPHTRIVVASPMVTMRVIVSPQAKGECRSDIEDEGVMDTRPLVIPTTEHQITQYGHTYNEEWNQVQAPIRSSVVKT